MQNLILHVQKIFRILLAQNREQIFYRTNSLNK